MNDMLTYRASNICCIDYFYCFKNIGWLISLKMFLNDDDNDDDDDDISDSDDKENMIDCTGTFKKPSLEIYPVSIEIDPVDRSYVYLLHAKLEVQTLVKK